MNDIVAMNLLKIEAAEKISHHNPKDHNDLSVKQTTWTFSFSLWILSDVASKISRLLVPCEQEEIGRKIGSCRPRMDYVLSEATIISIHKGQSPQIYPIWTWFSGGNRKEWCNMRSQMDNGFSKTSLNWVQPGSKRFMQKGLFGNPVKERYLWEVCNCKIHVEHPLWIQQKILAHLGALLMAAVLFLLSFAVSLAVFLWLWSSVSHASESNVFFPWKKQHIIEKTDSISKHVIPGYTSYTMNILNLLYPLVPCEAVLLPGDHLPFGGTPIMGH